MDGIDVSDGVARHLRLAREVDRLHVVAVQGARAASPGQQRADLGACLDELIADTQAGKAYFKVYRQFKMYNDPRFNPALVAERAKQQG